MGNIDPHSVFSNGESVKLDDLSFYAELKVTKRNRLGKLNNDKPLIINFIGANSNGEFTTDWTDNKENFGIKSIDFKITSSYVPQVDIIFEDVRGQALFNNFHDSKYQVIFDMPPPIFDLTLKGYYGQSVTYRLHLVKQSTKFVNNNSFEISASFVGMTFAPLADLYVDYLEVAPYLNENTLLNDSATNTFWELKNKSNQLSTIIKTATAEDSKFLNDITFKNSQLLEVCNNYQERFISDIKNVADITTGQNNLIYVNRDKNNSNIIHVSYKYKVLATEHYPNQTVYENLLSAISDKKTFFKENNIAVKIIKDIPAYENLPVIEFTNDQYVKVFSIDLTNVDKNIRQVIDKNDVIIYQRQKQIDENVTKLVYSELKGGPTLANILSIIVNDAKRFFTELKSVVINAEKERDGNNDTSHGEEPKYAFPDYYVLDSNNKKVKSIPKDPTWAEVVFVNNYINAKMKVSALNKASSDINFEPNTNEEYTFVPINPFDSILDVPNEYLDATKDNILYKIIYRGLILLNITNNFDSLAGRNGKILVNAHAKLEAMNILTVLQGKEKLLDAFIQQINSPDFKFNSIPILDNLKQVSRDSIDYKYNSDTLFKIRNSSDFDAYLGTPVLKESTELVSTPVGNYNEYIVKYNDTLKKLNKDNGYLSQYNVPFFIDQKMKGGFVNKSEFVSGEVFYFKETTGLSSATSFDNLMEKMFIDNLLQIDNHIIPPFDIPNFKRTSAIHEIPHFVLIAWGFILSNLNVITQKYPVYKTNVTKWQKIPDFIKTQFISYYTNFKNKYNNLYSDPTGTFMLKLKNAEKEKGNRIDEFFATDFVIEFTEIKYMSVGDYRMFNYNNNYNPDFRDDFTLYNEYFNVLKSELLVSKNIVKKEINNQKSEVKSKIDNADLKTELYYNFKSFVDKWMLNTPDEIDNMLSMENFLMVDRSFNNIGEDVMLDLSPLYSTQTSADTSIYTLLLNLLTKNNFEFFALPSYINYNESGLLWSNSNIQTVFGTNHNVNTKTKPKFICMYIGGTSSQLDINISNGDSHKNDSDDYDKIVDLKTDAVQAFNVDFGTHNQSFFYGLELDQLEYKETNESIILLDKIANSDQNSSTTASNSLFNTYQQRSYTATFSMMGNMMIQPTMYFDLKNVAMFKGTYLILEVNHKITPNSISSVFKGVRVPKVPKPYVTNYTIVSNIDIGSASGLNGGSVYNSGLNTGKPKKDIDLIGRNTNPVLTNKEKAFLDVIAFAEGVLLIKSDNGYNTLYGGTLINPWNRDYKLGHNFPSAAGRYQFLQSSWLKGGKNEPFNPTNQDKRAIDYIRESFNKYKLDLNNVNENNFRKYLDTVANTWASLPYYNSHGLKPKYKGWTLGESFYGTTNNATEGKSQRPRGNTLQKLWSVFTMALGYYEGTIVNKEGLTKDQIYYINQLRPEVQSKFISLIHSIQNETNYKVIITSSYRGIEKQMVQQAGDNRNAQPGFSTHNYGLAIDVNLSRGNQDITSETSKSIWISTGVVDLAKSLGFLWGGDFPNYYDPVHFEIASPTGTRYVTSKLYDKAIAKYGSINNVEFDGTKIPLT